MSISQSDGPLPPDTWLDRLPRRVRVLAPILLAAAAAIMLIVPAFTAGTRTPQAAFFPAAEPAEAARPVATTAGAQPGAAPSTTARQLRGLAASGAPANAAPSPGAGELDPSVRRLPGPVPSAGTGSFRPASSPGRMVGSSGQLRRYRVSVENGSGVDAEQFAAVVDRALGDGRSWTAGGRLRLQRVPPRTPHDFTVVLATAGTAGRLCAAGGINIRVGGRPYTSCRVSGTVVINLDRWQRSVDHLVAAGVPLDAYRAYVVNHEVGHELGYRHEGCPARGAPAPVMMQQTFFLNGCEANPWPYPQRRTT